MAYEEVLASVDYILKKTNLRPKTAIILGSGLGNFVKDIEIDVEIPYGRIPNFPISTVEGHKGSLIIGTINGVSVLVMSGRFHYYEGYEMQQLTFPIRVMFLFGIKNLLLTNVAGSVNENLLPGDLVFLSDHINLQADNPLRGYNDLRFGPRFPDMLNTYDKDLIQFALKEASNLKIRAFTGVYAALQGPNLETPAEYRYLNRIGADLVGMSTVPEVLVGRHMNMKIFVGSVVSNKCFPIEEIVPTTVKDVLEVAQKSEPYLSKILNKMVAYLG
jgi:purine-nucleoside phosphorylase